MPHEYSLVRSADASGIGSFAYAEYNQAPTRAYLGTYANATAFGFAAGEAVYKVGFDVPTARQIRFRAEIYRQGAADVFGTAAFAGTYKVWHVDGERLDAEVDHWFTPERAAEICLAIAEDAVGAGEYTTVAAAIRGLAQDAFEDNLISIFESRLQTFEVERLVIDRTYYASPGWNVVGVGLRSQASGVAWDMGEAYSMGVVPSITVWGIGTPDPPTIEGPSVACPGANCTFITFSESCDPGERFTYRFDYGDGNVSQWSGPVYCGTPVSDTYYYTTPDTYTVTAQARDYPGGHEYSIASQEITIGTYTPAGTPLVYAEALSCTSAAVRWTPVPGATFYRLYRDEAPPNGLVYEGTSLTFTETPPARPTYPIYSYRLRAYNDCGYVSAPWPTHVHPNRPPDEPPAVAAVDLDSCAVIVTWTPVDSAYAAGGHDWSGVATSYEIWRATTTNPQDAVQIGNTNCTSCTRFSDWPPVPEQYYTYWVKSRNTCGISDLAHYARARRADIPDSGPTNVTATPGTYCTKVRIEWNDDSWDNFVKRDGVRISAIRSGWFEDTTAQPGVVYSYSVESCPLCDLDGTRNHCRESAAVQGWRATQAPAPAWVNATDGANCNQVTITWSTVPTATSYAIRRNTTTIATGLTSPNYTDAPPLGGSTSPYTYTVIPNNACGDGLEKSDIGYKLAIPPASTAVNATDGSQCAKVRITWNPATDAISYSVHRNAVAIASSLTTLSFDDTPPALGSSNPYTYTVYGANSCGTGPGFSDVGYAGESVTESPQLTVVDGCGACGAIVLWWDPIPLAATYSVYRQEDGQWVHRAKDLPTPGYVDGADPLHRSHSYVYRVHAVGGCTETQSNEVACAIVCKSKDRPRQLVAGPTPFNPGTVFTFCRAVSEPVQLVIYDLRGRIVRRLYDDVAPAESILRIQWDGKSDQGTSAGTGVYIVRLQPASGPVESVKITLVR